MTTDTHHPNEHKPPGPAAPEIGNSIRLDEELAKAKRALARERENFRKRLADVSRMLQSSTTGFVTLDKSGLIDGVNTRAIEMFGADKSDLLKKPASLFIAPEDQSTFYINRSRIFSGDLKDPFEIRLRKKNGTIWSARVDAQAIETPNQRLPGMLLAIEDVSSYRQALETLQFKEDFVNLLFSIVDDLSVWSTTDIDEIIIYSLEKIGLVSQADRVYICLFYDRRTRLSITHEWLGEGVDSPASVLQGATIGPFSHLLHPMKKRTTVAVADIGTLSDEIRAGHEGFHSPGVKALLYTPLFYGRYLLGIIGCDAVKQPIAWTGETQNLLKCVGGAIVSALIRRQVQKAPVKIREPFLQFIESEPSIESDEFLEYEGPIEVIGDESVPAAGEKTCWHIEAGEPDDPNLLSKALLKDGTTANIACKNCNQQKQIDISEIRTLGTRLKATCVCGHEIFLKIELRREHRKTVHLEGVFIRGPGDRIALKSDDWGRILINNISRNGIGFKIFDKHDIRVKDRFRVKFTLDNTASSVVQKEVVVRSVAGEIIGCEFTRKEPSDVTLGFYMMT